jgi:anhydro-N-acetylmuramic acid kinase
LLDDRRARPGSLALAEAMITSRHAEAVEAFLATNSIDRATVELIGTATPFCTGPGAA